MGSVIRVGDTVGGYEILSKLSAGGMATLYLGRRGGAAGFRQHVAIKVVHEHLAEDRIFVRMFLDEALLSARIHHPNVVHIEELRELDGQHFLVMEYVSGVALVTLMRRLSRMGRGLTPELAAHVAIQVADGLHAAHELKDETGKLEGVVHRDVSPQNVLLAWEGHVKLIDFGVAKARSRMQQTTGASLKGKIRYMAPEQARGAEVDRRTDVYALGIVLWEMLTMRKRFNAPNDFALLDLVRNPEPIAPSQLNPAIGPELDAVVMRALELDVDKRYASAQDFRRALAGAMPQALAVDASHLSDLIRAACTQELDRARANLPSSMHLPSRIPTADDVEPEPLRTMTISASQVFEYLEGSDDSAGLTPSAVDAADASGSGTGANPNTTPQTGSIVAANASSGRPLLIVAALAALLLVGVGGYFAMSPSNPSSSSVAVPLAPRNVPLDPVASSPTPRPRAATPPATAVVPSTPGALAADPVLADGGASRRDLPAQTARPGPTPEHRPNASPTHHATVATATEAPTMQATTMQATTMHRSTMQSSTMHSSTMQATTMQSSTMQSSTMQATTMQATVAVPLADDFGF